MPWPPTGTLVPTRPAVPVAGLLALDRRERIGRLHLAAIEASAHPGRQHLALIRSGRSHPTSMPRLAAIIAPVVAKARVLQFPPPSCAARFATAVEVRRATDRRELGERLRLAALG